MTDPGARARARTVLFLGAPALWPRWPFLPVARRTRGRVPGAAPGVFGTAEELADAGWRVD